MNNLKIFSAIILSSSLLFFNSCDDAISPTNTIDGRIYHTNHAPAINFKVEVGDKIANTSDDGSFRLNDISIPYDLVVSDSLYKFVVIYKGLRTVNPSLPLFHGYNSTSTTIYVYLPDSILNLNLYGKVIFTDGNFANGYGSFRPNAPPGPVIIGINESTPVTGRLIVLTYKKDSNGKIVSYENYGESNELTISPGGIVSYNFTRSELSLNPGELNADVTLRVPSGTGTVSSRYYITFTSKGVFDYSGNMEFENYLGNNFSVKIPGGLPRQFHSMIENTSFGNRGFSGEKYLIFPGNLNTLQIKTPPYQISPDDGTKGVENNTQFSFNKGDGNGIYIIAVMNLSRPGAYHIVKENNNFTLEEIKDIAFGNINNNNFDWQVRKLGELNSMDDFATNYFNLQVSFNSSSQHWNFLTAP